MLGSFDVYIEKSKVLLEKNNSDESEELLKKISITLRTSIVNEDNNEYIGYISVIDMYNENSYTSLILELEEEIKDEEVVEIVIKTIYIMI